MFASILRNVPFLLFFATSVGLANETPTSLLAGPKIQLRINAKPQSVDVRKALFDGNPNSTLKLPTSECTLEIRFQKAVVPEQLEVALDSNDRPFLEVVSGSANKPGRVLITHFFSANQRTAQLRLPQATAHWIRLRFRSSDSSQLIGLGDISLTGHSGPLATSYRFKESPAGAIHVLDKLRSISQLKPSSDERSLLMDAADGQLDDWSLAEAALLASGTTKRGERQRYLRAIAGWQADLRNSLAAATPQDRAGRLLKWMHDGPMKGGYVAKQTRLSELIDTGKFNCVSSAALYSVLGKGLGLDVRGVEVPDHAFAVVYWGQDHADVETTTRGGFNPIRDPKARTKFESTTGFRYIPHRHRSKRREVSPTGLVALIYYNRGVEALKDKRFHQSLQHNFMAISLDREAASAIKNALAAFSRWSQHLSENGSFEQAITVVQAGLDIAPNDKSLQNNHIAAWHTWARHLVDNEKLDEAVAVIHKAQAATNSDHFRHLQSWAFIHSSRKHSKLGRWDQAEKIVAEGLERFRKGETHAALNKWSASLLLARFSNEVKANRFAAASDTLLRFKARHPQEKRFAQGAAFLTQQWSRARAKTAGSTAALDTIRQLRRRFPAPGVTSVAHAFVAGEIDQLNREEKYSEAAKLLADCVDLYETHGAKYQDLVASVHVHQAKRLQGRGDWDEAIMVLQQAITDNNDNKSLKRALVALCDRQARQEMSRRNYKQAAECYRLGLMTLPEDAIINNNVAFLSQKWAEHLADSRGEVAAEKLLATLPQQFVGVKGLDRVGKAYVIRRVQKFIKKKRYEPALAMVARCEQLLGDQKTQEQLVRMVYGDQADAARAQKKPARVVEIYRAAVQRHPKYESLKHSARVAWDAWARTHIDNQQWSRAARVYQLALDEFPGERMFVNNLAFCRQQAQQGAARNN